MPAPHASIVIPAYDEGARLPPYLAELVELGVARADLPVELVVVDDGSTPDHLDRHRACVAAASARLSAAGAPHRVRLVEGGVNRGKGAAIRLGWSSAAPDAAWLGFLDADGAIPAHEVWRLVAATAAGDAEVLCGSRVLMAGHTIRRSAWRHAQGRVFATLTERAFRLGCYDTQCGYKLVRAPRLRAWLPHLREGGWLLDVELLALARRCGAPIREQPIDWSDPGGSKVRFGVDALRMLLGLRRIRRHLEALPWPLQQAAPAAGLPRIAP